MQAIRKSLSIHFALGVIAILLLSLSLTARAQGWQQPPRSEANLNALAAVQIATYNFSQADIENMEYAIYIPSSYDANKPTPLVMALHGVGSGIMYMMEYNNLLEYAEQYGYIIAAPMGYNERGWYGARGLGNEFNASRNARIGIEEPANLGLLSELDVMNVLALMLEKFNIDEQRIYLIGQSMGGGGSWYLGSKYPQIWAALAPMAPAVYISPDILTNITHIPVMVVMGDEDELVDLETTRQWVAKMDELKMNYEYIEVAGGSHSSAGRENIGLVFEFLSQHSK